MFLAALEGVKCAANLDDRVDVAGERASGGRREVGEVVIDAELSRGTAGMGGNVASRGEACVWVEVRPAEEFEEEGLERKGKGLLAIRSNYMYSKQRMRKQDRECGVCVIDRTSCS